MCPTLCNPMNCSIPGFSVHHNLPELAQTHIHWVSDAIQPSHPLKSPSPPAFNFSQHQGLFQVSALHIRWPKYWSFSFNISPSKGFPGSSDSKVSGCNSGDLGSIAGWENPLEKEMATHSSTLAWKIPWIEEPGGLQSKGLQRVGHDGMTEHACPIGEQYRDCSKFKNKTTVYLAIPLLGIYLKNTRNNSRKYVHSMLIMALLTVARLWRHHRDLQWDEQSWEAKSLLSTVNRLCHSYSTWPLQCKSSRRHMDTNKHVCQQNLIHYIEIGISYNLHVAQNIFPLLVFVISSPLFIFLLLE